MDNKSRSKIHQRIPELEKILQLINNSLYKNERDLIAEFNKPKYPVCLIIGNPRSGSTLLYQYLSSTGLFSYPSNIISRFYNAPYIGSLIHKMFIDLDYKNEIFGNQSTNFKSILGKTEGAGSPNEFWYFWRRFFKFDEIHKISDDNLQYIEKDLLLKELASIEIVFNKPLCIKASMLNWNLQFLYETIENSIFIFIKRDEIYNMHSLYNARRHFFNNINQWYSFKPPEYLELKEKNVYAQLAGQVIYTNKHIENKIKNFDQKRTISVSYEEFCLNPSSFLNSLEKKINKFSYAFQNKKAQADISFKPMNIFTNEDFNIIRAQDEIRKIKNARDN